MSALSKALGYISEALENIGEGLAQLGGWMTPGAHYYEDASGVASHTRSDFDAIASDWEQVGNDLRMAMGLDPLPSNRFRSKYFAEAHGVVYEISFLESDWNSYGADVIDPDAIKTAHMLFIILESAYGDALGYDLTPYDVAPISDGRIQVEWRYFSTYIEVEIETGPEWLFNYLIINVLPEGRVYKEEHNVGMTHVAKQIFAVLTDSVKW